eukprot:PhM_4_TR18489/c0_g1_i1/m.65391
MLLLLLSVCVAIATTATGLVDDGVTVRLLATEGVDEEGVFFVFFLGVVDGSSVTDVTKVTSFDDFGDVEVDPPTTVFAAFLELERFAEAGADEGGLLFDDEIAATTLFGELARLPPVLSPAWNFGSRSVGASPSSP